MSKTFIKVEGHTSLVRDVRSNAIVNHNVSLPVFGQQLDQMIKQ